MKLVLVDNFGMSGTCRSDILSWLIHSARHQLERTITRGLGKRSMTSGKIMAAISFKKAVMARSSGWGWSKGSYTGQ
eukprot:scaffold5267_cov90-Cylindrotheca_fusiformis.AAC.6